MKPGTPGFFGARLKEAREARGLTAISLADGVGVSRAAIYQYEKDIQSPRPEIMAKISIGLNLPVAYFLQPPETVMVGTPFFRSLASATRTIRTRLERRMGWLCRIAAFLREFVEFPFVNLPNIDVPKDPTELTDEDIENIAAIARTHWELGDGPLGSIVILLENNGAIVSRDDFMLDSVDALSLWAEGEGVPYFFLNNRKGSAARSRMDIGHEIGHILLHRRVNKAFLALPEIHNTVEAQAFRFGRAFSLPAEAFLSEVGSLSLDSFQQLKAKWKVSIGMMIKRAEDLGLLSAEQVQQLWKRRATRGWHVWEPLDDELPVETPHLLPQAFRLLLDQKLISRQEILTNCPYSANDIEVLSGLERGYLSEQEIGPKVIAFPSGSKRT